MNTYTIPQKPSNAGSIHDIRSEMFDRVIRFAPGCTYAVVLAAYYGGVGYTTHKTALSAARQARTLERQGYSLAVIDKGGREYGVCHPAAKLPLYLR